MAEGDLGFLELLLGRTEGGGGSDNDGSTQGFLFVPILLRVMPSPAAQGMVIFLSELLPPGAGAAGDGGSPPASKASIEGMKAVQVREGEADEECAICLDGLDQDGGSGGDGAAAAREMPCGHRFHGGCIERWLGLHGTCPLCRYRMPEEGVAKGDAPAGEAQRRGEMLVVIVMGEGGGVEDGGAAMEQ